MSSDNLSATGTTAQARFVGINEYYRRCGLWVFPITLGTERKPLDKWKPFQREPPTAEQIKRWYKHNRGANAAMPTGEATGIVVVDLDSAEALAYAVERGLPETWQVDTTRGQHRYYKHPGFIVRNSNSGVFKDIDIKGDGGSILCAGSENKRWHEGRSPHDLPLADLPEWIRNHPALRHRDPPAPAPARPYLGETTKWARAAFEGERQRLLDTGPGARNSTLFAVGARLGGLVAAGALDEGEVRSALVEVAESWGDDLAKSRDTIKRSIDIGKSRPAALPDRSQSHRQKTTASKSSNRANSELKAQSRVTNMSALPPAPPWEEAPPFPDELPEAPDWDAGEFETVIKTSEQLAAKAARAKVRDIKSAKPKKEKPKGPDNTPRIDPDLTKPPFRCLGFEGSNYVFYSNDKRTLVRLTTAAMRNQINLYPLARREWWQAVFPALESPRTDWIEINRAASYLIQKCHKAGVFDEKENSRGRGAWLDNDRVIYHGGDYLIVDGERKPLDALTDSKYFYTLAKHVAFDPGKIADDAIALDVLNLAKKFRWRDRTPNDKTVSGLLFAGWVALAPIAGLLEWRPHFWIVGDGGAGKSEVIRYYVRPLLVVHIHTTDATAAGARGKIGNSAVPFIFDEADPDSSDGQQPTRSQSQMKEFLKQMRPSSAADGSSALRGAGDGGYNEFKGHNSYLLASVLKSMKQTTDLGRITVGEIVPGDSVQWFGNIKDKDRKSDPIKGLKWELEQTCTPDNGQQLLARTLRGLKTLIANIEVFHIAITTGTMRVGQQYSALLAGAAWLESTKLYTVETATKWLTKNEVELAGYDPTKLAGGTPSERAIAWLNQQKIRVIGADDRTRDFSIAELISCARGSVTRPVEREEAKRVLIGEGLKVVKTDVLVCPSHAQLDKHFRGTDFTHYSDILKRHEGAVVDNPTRGMAGRPIRISNWPDSESESEDE